MTEVTLEYTISELTPDTAIMIGLDGTNSTASYQDLEYATYILHNSTTQNLPTLRIFENGAYRGIFVTLAIDDVVKIQRDASGVVTYYVNNTLQFTSPTTSTGGLSLGSSAYGTGNWNTGNLRLTNITLS